MPSDWYHDLNKAPWKTPGWVFGSMWTTIMISYAVYMVHLIKATNTQKKIVLLFVAQWFLNVAWNPIFFHFKSPLLGLVIISLLTLLSGYFLLRFTKTLKLKSIFIAPYFLWIFFATSLNAYIVLFN